MSDLVGNQEDMFSHDTAHIMFTIIESVGQTGRLFGDVVHISP